MSEKNPVKKQTIEVCLSPQLLEHFNCEESIVVVIDVLRATSSICVAFENGAERIIPVSSVTESMTFKQLGFLVGAERNGEMIEGFDMGNSPFSYMGDHIMGSSIALTTTNGTMAINAAKNAHRVVIGSFLNLDALCEWLKEQHENIICLCSGWRNMFNLEDTLLAGAVVERLTSEFRFSSNCDSAIAARYLYQLAKSDLYGFLSNSSHRQRLERLHIEKEVEYCLTPNQTNVVPVLHGDFIVNQIILEESK
jgi:2-phosphosulfolactate phosphatase